MLCPGANTPIVMDLFCRLLFSCFAIEIRFDGSDTTIRVLPHRHCVNILDSIIQAIPSLDNADEGFYIGGAAVPNQRQYTFVGIQFILDGLLLCYAWGSDAIVAHCGFGGAAFAGRTSAITLLRKQKGKRKTLLYVMGVYEGRGETIRWKNEKRERRGRWKGHENVSEEQSRKIPLICACDKVDRQLLSGHRDDGVGGDSCEMKRPKSLCVGCCPSGVGVTVKGHWAVQCIQLNPGWMS